ncbi:hypothetical protein COT77_03040 [Candidatus Berkelbacteria bacterium CG10_big_fil_rev_8_21_14_0_10_41_12]|uniref:Uncharacterized protein n=1 Tax=Candidatus Berkelbacteria bacterium CG10_big_fil_rev_8_21_14_0_10_41_12 TaxID=1974513 RepID=A0A2M6WWI5_9BACT|nr:MAG: hypothetical protein COT77_03040 [Candidatus Berkelbacteria bacterium CG10_big_fil_rev_8_21_14_0_10_41_12]
MQIRLEKDALNVKDKSALIKFSQKTEVNDILLEGEGEYEIGGVIVTGIDKNSYIFDIDDISLGYMDFNEKVDPEMVEKLSNVEALIVCLDGELDKVLDAISQIEPRVAIFVGDQKAEEKLSHSSTKFEKTESLKLAKSDLTDEETKNYFFQVNARE